MSKQWNPLQDLMLLQDRMNRLFEDATERRARADAETDSQMETAGWYPTADVYDNAGEYLIAVDLPGIDRAAMEISIDDNKIDVRGTRVVPVTLSSRAERPAGRFQRTFSVPSLVDQRNIRAEYNDGVLEIHLPKRKEQQSKRIEIKIS